MQTPLLSLGIPPEVVILLLIEAGLLVVAAIIRTRMKTYWRVGIRHLAPHRQTELTARK